VLDNSLYFLQDLLGFDPFCNKNIWFYHIRRIFGWG